jgi:hypothetical protein
VRLATHDKLRAMFVRLDAAAGAHQRRVKPQEDT